MASNLSAKPFNRTCNYGNACICSLRSFLKPYLVEKVDTAEALKLSVVVQLGKNQEYPTSQILFENPGNEGAPRSLTFMCRMRYSKA